MQIAVENCSKGTFNDLIRASRLYQLPWRNSECPLLPTSEYAQVETYAAIMLSIF